MPRQKSLSRLRTILESVTLAAVATTGAVAASPSLASAATLVPAPADAAPADASLDELAHRLAACLTDLPPLVAAGATAELAMSPDVADRAVLAQALAWIFPLPTDDVLIDHLADDPAPQVRAAVARAAWTRRTALGDTGIVRRLLGDADPEVRAAAWLAVKR